MKLMIVDDHRGMREMLKSFFCSPEDEATFCPDGVEALATYRQCRPDWVLMDLAMKELDGITATRQIRIEFPEARVIMVTEHDNPRLREMARQAGACAFVAKDNLAEARQIMQLDRSGPVPPVPPGSPSTPDFIL